MEFKNFIIKEEKNQKVLYLYMKNNFFAMEAGDLDNHEQVTKNIENYIRRKNIPFSGKKVKVFASSLLIGTFFVSCGKKINTSTLPSSIPNSNTSDMDTSFDSSLDSTILTNYEKVQLAKENLELENLDSLVTSFTLPLTGTNDTTITWISENPAIIINNDTAVITRDDDENIDGYLIATITYGDVSDTKNFPALVLKNPPPAWLDDTEFTMGINFVFRVTDQSYSVDLNFPYNYNGDVLIPSAYNGFPVRRVNYSEISINGKLRLGANIIEIATIEYMIAKNIEVSEYNPKYAAKNNALYEGTTLLRYFGSGGDYETSPDTTTIGQNAFSGYLNFNNIIITDGVEEIAYQAFSGCSANYLELANSVTKIGDFIFSYSNIKEIKLSDNIEALSSAAFEGSAMLNLILPKNLKVIGSGAFAFTGLKIINLPDSLETIEQDAFYNSAVESLYIPDSVTTIRQGAFTSSTSLRTIYFGKNVAEIGGSIFSDTPNLTSVAVSPLNKNYSALNNVLFDYDKTELIAYPGGMISNYTIPLTVTKIGEGAFASCWNLNSIKLPNGLKVIEKYAFAGTSLLNVELPESLEEIKEYVFAGNFITVTVKKQSSQGVIKIASNSFANNVTAIYVPDSTSLNDYKNAQFWSSYKAKIYVTEA